MARGRLYVCIRARMAVAAARRGVRLRIGRGCASVMVTRLYSRTVGTRVAPEGTLSETVTGPTESGMES